MFYVVRFLSTSTFPYAVLSTHTTLTEAQAAHAVVYLAASPADQAAATYGIVSA